MDEMKNCAESVNEEVITCAACGVVIDDPGTAYQTPDGKYYCCEDCLGDAGYFICDDCGEMHHFKHSNWLDDERTKLVCDKCFARYHTCVHCGCIIEDMDEACYLGDGEYACSADCAYGEGYERCIDCGDWVHQYYAESVYDGDNCFDGFICRDCWYSDRYEQCHACGHIHHRRHLTLTDYNHLGSYHICDHCMDELNQCPVCGEFVDDDNWNTYEGRCIECCGDDNDGIIQDYHDVDDWKHFGFDPHDRYLGIELEVEDRDGYGNASMAEEIQNILGENRVAFERDGSLDDGFEIITHPHTYEEFCNLPWEQALSQLSGNGFRSHDTSTCGLHIHVSREWFGDRYSTEYVENLGKLFYIYEANWDFFLKLSRRTEDGYRHYANRYYDAETFEDAKMKTQYGGSRYSAINNCNYSTVEFRLGRGTLNYQSFMAWIDVHIALCRNASKVPVNDLTNMELWLDGIRPETAEYIELRGLTLDRPAVEEQIMMPTHIEVEFEDSDLLF